MGSMAKLSQIVHTLAEPIKVGGKDYSVITLRAPNTGMLRAMGREGSMMKLVAVADRVDEADRLEQEAKRLAEEKDPGAEAARKAAEEASIGLLSIYDDLVPTLAIIAGVDVAVIDELDINETNALLAKMQELDLGPLSRGASSA